MNTNCFDEKCPSRHPNPCKYGHRCLHKFFFFKCLYSHIGISSGDQNKLEELEKRIVSLEKGNAKTAVNELAKQIDNKLVTFENKIGDFRKVTEERNLHIILLEDKLNNFEKLVANKYEDLKIKLKGFVIIFLNFGCEVMR